MNDPKSLIHIRISDASTVENDYSSDEDLFQEESKLQLDPHENILLFSPLSEESKLHYLEILPKLKEIYDFLDREIEPICIRDQKTICGTSINLCSTGQSRIFRRRSTFFLS